VACEERIGGAPAKGLQEPGPLVCLEPADNRPLSRVRG
jgi:hypothetical protein